MGFFGGDNDNDDGQSQADQLASEQLSMNKAELEAKKQSLYQTRLDIIKGEGRQVWTPDYNAKAPVAKETRLPAGFPFGGRGFLS
jgi:hypothetical protein